MRTISDFQVYCRNRYNETDIRSYWTFSTKKYVNYIHLKEDLSQRIQNLMMAVKSGIYEKYQSVYQNALDAAMDMWNYLMGENNESA